MNKKAIIAMSGGVDSSVAAYLMKQKGYQCIGVTMKLFNNEEVGLSREHTCCSLADAEDARTVAYKIGIPYYVFNFTDCFKKEVIERFVTAYENGITPNPCIDCNRYLKFQRLFLRAQELGYDYVATGHYAEIIYNPKNRRYLLKKAADPNKDQTYVLYTMTQEQLAHTRFPLNELAKPEVRRIATEQGFLNAKKHDSQDICFVTNGNYSDFIQKYTQKQYPPGNFIDINGNILGKHQGIFRYTIGQRKGLAIACGEPMYVRNIDPQTNTVQLSREADLYTKSVIAKAINLIAVDKIEKPLHLQAKIRYRQTAQWATVTQTDDNTLQIEFDEPQRAVTKGQAVVIYDDDIVIGGGTIQ